MHLNRLFCKVDFFLKTVDSKVIIITNVSYIKTIEKYQFPGVPDIQVCINHHLLSIRYSGAIPLG